MQSMVENTDTGSEEKMEAEKLTQSMEDIAEDQSEEAEQDQSEEAEQLVQRYSFSIITNRNYFLLYFINWRVILSFCCCTAQRRQKKCKAWWKTQTQGLRKKWKLRNSHRAWRKSLKSSPRKLNN